ncbi:DUF805 domain-containing protein [Vibrio agarivorans]|uniref:DUF805 domain-containing protein n=1 Tax=Vibrio agarivorans TaxID=153622 RepID=A0ABT7XWE3_9VIBR|nr:DUF805 domain-containing protein [Vibrio agarivorans]MDN2480065.1 DUF805 domain-containing protein [Vibrio agarivorans]
MKELLFSFQGRVGRKTFWLWNVVYYLSIFGFAIGINTLFPSLAHLLLPAFLLLVLIPDLAITAKRWHDRNRPTWFLLLNIPLVIGRLAVPAGEMAASQPTLVQTLVSFGALVCGLWIFVECGLMKGTDGANQYGQDPVQK